MWTYNYSDELYHFGIRKGWTKKNHKYIKREWKNGRWVYYYPSDLMSERQNKSGQSQHVKTKYTNKLLSYDEHRTITSNVTSNGKTTTYKTTQIERNVGRIRQTVDRVVARLNQSGPINYGVSVSKSNKNETVNVKKSNKLFSGTSTSLDTHGSTKNGTIKTTKTVEVGLIEQAVDVGKAFMDKKLKSD